MSTNFYWVNVFTDGPLSGNSLPVIFSSSIASIPMQKLAHEFKQTETIFLQAHEESFLTRIFTVDQELPFAGHPLLGAAAAIYKKNGFEGKACIRLLLPNRQVDLKVEELHRNRYLVSLNQGGVALRNLASDNSTIHAMLTKMGLTPADLLEHLPIAWASTGLPYVLIPVKEDALARLQYQGDIESDLKTLEASFAYVFSIKDGQVEARSFDNRGKDEDPATGSAAGPLAYYLVKNEIKPHDSDIHIHQGRFCGRPSLIRGEVVKNSGIDEVIISGNVQLSGEGWYEIYP